MSLITSPELFINMKRIPDILSQEYKAFWKEEKRKAKYGVTINGVRIPGWLYWHINHWIIDVDTEDQERPSQRPDLRDNEWIIGEAIDKAETDRRGLLILGSRQLGKSELNASYMGRRCILFKNSQNVLAGLSSDDLALLISKLKRGFEKIDTYFAPTTITANWEHLVQFGTVVKDNKGIKYSELLIRNLEKGKSSEKLAGPTTSALVIDEVGKGPFLKSFIAAQPSLETPFGWRCMPLFTGTSGSFDKSADLQKFYGKLSSFRFNCIEIKDTKGVKKRFIPGYMASRIERKKVRLSDYLGVERGSELDYTGIKIIRDEVTAIEWTLAERKRLEDIGEVTLWKKEIMYYPITEDELFLTEDSDDVFADIKPYAAEHLAYLEASEIKESYGWMIRGEDGKPKRVAAGPHEKPIQNFPCGEEENRDAPITFYDDPITGQEFGILHVSGMDPYNQDTSFWSTSLGTLYIFRRTYDPIGGKMQNRIVASYVARPEQMSKWKEQCRLLLEYYGATCLPENADSEFIRWMDEKNVGYYLEDSFTLAKEIAPNTKNTKTKGLSPTISNIRYGNGLFKNYCLEDIVVGFTEDFVPIMKKGIVRILDKAMLKEIINYKPKDKVLGNVDRIVGFRHALILASYKDKYFPMANVLQKQQEEVPQTLSHSPFSGSHASPFKLNRKAFRGGTRL